MSTGQEPHGAGRSSFEFVDLNRVLHTLSLLPSTVFLDLGCGRGNYAIPVAEFMGPRGKLYILEFKKVEDGPGPPLSVRLSPEETEKVVAPFGFVKDRVIDLGPFHYLLAASMARPASAAPVISVKKG